MPAANAVQPSPQALRPRSLADGLRRDDNAFGFLRLLLATLVIVDHAFPLGGFGPDPMWSWSRGQEAIGGICVAAFFAISGYLITKSSVTTDGLQFLWRRALRILPAYWVVLLVAAFLVGPAVWWGDHHTLRGYFARSEFGPWAYLTKNWRLEIGSFRIHDLLATTTPYGRAIHESVFNGSLWTLIYEWNCYLLIFVLAAFGIVKRWRGLVLILAAASYLLLAVQVADPALPGRLAPWLKDVYTVRYTAIFLLGSAAALYSREIPLDDRLGFFSLAVYLVSLLKGGYFVAGYPAAVYLLLWLAARLPRVVRRINADHDYSYGTYLYGFLVQQYLAYLGVQRLGLGPSILIAICVAYAAAWLSWHLVESPALKLKEIGPGRGLTLLRARLARSVRLDPMGSGGAPNGQSPSSTAVAGRDG
jgi:peptidoglycan/LPS O-acetylase OafA/YrhL